MITDSSKFENTFQSEIKDTCRFVDGGEALKNWAGIAFSATMAVCAFRQYLVLGNYNFISPYPHEVTHGNFLKCLSGPGQYNNDRLV